MIDIEKLARDIVNKGNSAESIIIFDNINNKTIEFVNVKVFDVRSISKTVLSLACGILINESRGEFNLESYIYPIIKNKMNLENKKNLAYLKEIKVKHLLTHTTGYRDLILYSKDIRESDYDDLFDYVINYPLYHRPGTHFLYSNAGYYLLAITMEEYLKYDLFDFVQDRLLKPLGIENRSWDKFGNYIAGATKINLNAYDMLKIGKLIINNGYYDDLQIVDSNYIDLIQKPYNESMYEVKRKYISEDYYGYGIWISKRGVVFASGTGGQLIVILNDMDLIIVTTNSGSDSKSYKIKSDIDKLVDIIYEDRR
ncbi:serine hydrolase domain-containing protein [Anaerococcus provencensis]|uniref:serine hydrolase domain-containing protein n=1 Tax=Anaerococcus provencensis TaxID=938293 RepID=UPI0002F30E8C|nr:serine hydrolase [Anaerococcus provencensis]